VWDSCRAKEKGTFYFSFPGGKVECPLFQFHDVRINTQKGPALFCEKVEGLEIDGIRTLAPHQDSAVVDLKDVTGAYIHACRTTPGVFLRLQGKSSRDIVLQANEFGQAPSAIKIDEGVPASALIQK